MWTTQRIRRATAALLLPLVVLLGLSTARAFYRCAGMQVVRTECCCPKMHDSDESRAPAPDDALKAACCCSVEQGADVEAPAAHTNDREQSCAVRDASAMLAFAVVLPAPAVAPQVTRIPDPKQQLAPPRTTASLFSQHIALLV